MFELYPSQFPILNCLKLSNIKYLMLIMLNVWGSTFFYYLAIFTCCFCFCFLFCKHSFISMHTLYSNDNINTYFPVQMPTAIPTCHSNHRAIAWELYVSNAHSFKVDIPKLCKDIKSLHVKQHQIHKERGKITLYKKPFNKFLSDKHDILKYLSFNCKVLDLYNHPYTEIK